MIARSTEPREGDDASSRPRVSVALRGRMGAFWKRRARNDAGIWPNQKSGRQGRRGQHVRVAGGGYLIRRRSLSWRIWSVLARASSPCTLCVCVYMRLCVLSANKLPRGVAKQSATQTLHKLRRRDAADSREHARPGQLR
jgi:hypothetical protein